MIMEQTKGREIADLTVTDANLFHMEPLEAGKFNHAIYKLGWGHFHCNTVARDRGMEETLDWMEAVLIRNGRIKAPISVLTDIIEKFDKDTES